MDKIKEKMNALRLEADRSLERAEVAEEKAKVYEEKVRNAENEMQSLKNKIKLLEQVRHCLVTVWVSWLFSPFSVCPAMCTGPLTRSQYAVGRDTTVLKGWGCFGLRILGVARSVLPSFRDTLHR